MYISVEDALCTELVDCDIKQGVTIFVFLYQPSLPHVPSSDYEMVY